MLSPGFSSLGSQELAFLSSFHVMLAPESYSENYGCKQQDDGLLRSRLFTHTHKRFLKQIVKRGKKVNQNGRNYQHLS